MFIANNNLKRKKRMDNLIQNKKQEVNKIFTVCYSSQNNNIHLTKDISGFHINWNK